MSKKLALWAKAANIPDQHVDFCVREAIESEYVFDNISEFVQYLYTVQMDEEIWDELFWEWNVTLSSFLSRGRE